MKERMGRIIRFNPKRRKPRRGTKVRPARFAKRRTSWREAWASMRPAILLIVLASMAYVFALPGVMPAPALLSSEPQVIEGRFVHYIKVLPRKLDPGRYEISAEVMATPAGHVVPAEVPYVYRFLIAELVGMKVTWDHLQVVDEY